MLRGGGKVQTGGNSPDGFVEAVQQGGAAALSAAMDPVAAGDAEGCDGQFYYQMQPQVFGVQQELVGQALDHLALDPMPVVLDVFEQVGRCDYQQAGIDETPVPPGVKVRDGRGQREVQFAKDGAG